MQHGHVQTRKKNKNKISRGGKMSFDTDILQSGWVNRGAEALHS